MPTRLGWPKLVTVSNSIRLWLILPVAAFVSACAQNIVVKAEFPEPVVQSLPLNIGVYYEEAFSSFRYTEELPDDITWSFELGSSNRRLFEGIFKSLFNITSSVAAAGGPEPAYAALDAVIAPKIEAFEFSVPRQSRSDQYSVWIRYNLYVYSPAGKLITKWPVSAYGQSDARTFGTDAAMREAVIKAMRDAAASIIVGFAEDPKIKEALYGDDES